MFDCLHDMGDPAGAAAHVRETLADDGTWMIVEPAAGDRVEDNLNPVGRAYYALLHPALHALLAVPGSRPGPRGPSRRGAAFETSSPTPDSAGSRRWQQRRSTACTRPGHVSSIDQAAP